ERETRIADVADVTHARRSLDRLEALIADILDVARLDRGIFDMNVQPVDLVPMLEEVAGTLTTPEQPVVVKASQREVFVPADQARIRQCVENLLSNATRYSPRGAPVTVLVSVEKAQEGEQARVDVIDEGPGVSEDMLP